MLSLAELICGVICVISDLLAGCYLSWYMQYHLSHPLYQRDPEFCGLGMSAMSRAPMQLMAISFQIGVFFIFPSVAGTRGPCVRVDFFLLLLSPW
ncbi:hypothetical protein V8C42DRAFT_323809 [Trichoderma barbatum]